MGGEGLRAVVAEDGHLGALAGHAGPDWLEVGDGAVDEVGHDLDELGVGNRRADLVVCLDGVDDVGVGGHHLRLVDALDAREQLLAEPRLHVVAVDEDVRGAVVRDLDDGHADAQRPDSLL